MESFDKGQLNTSAGNYKIFVHNRKSFQRLKKGDGDLRVISPQKYKARKSNKSFDKSRMITSFNTQKHSQPSSQM